MQTFINLITPEVIGVADRLLLVVE